MKRILLFILLVASLNAKAVQYTWSGGASGTWTSTNFSPTGTPGSADEVIINTANAVITMPTSSFSLGKLTISNTATLQTSVSIIITVGSASFSGNVFTVASGRTLTLQTTGSTTAIGINITVATGYTGSIDGNIVLGGLTATSQAHKIMHQSAARGITFNSGSSCTTTATVYGSSTTPFSTTATSGINNNVTFASGSTFYFNAGLPFGSIGPYVEFQSGSNYVHLSASTPSISGRTFGNFTINSSPTTPPASILGGTGISFENLTISQGSWALTTASGGGTSGTFNISKDISVASGATLTFGNVATGANSVGTIINFTGATQTISNSGTIAVSATGSGTGHKTVFNVNSGSSLTINSNFDLGASNADAKRNFNILTGGALTIGTGKTFTVGQATLAVNSGGSLTINSTATLSNNYSSAKSVGIAGTFTNNGAVSGQGLINLNGAATQTISGTGSITNLTISNSTANGISYASGTQSISGAFINGGTFTGAGIVRLNGTANSVSGTGTINNLTIANGSGNSTTISSGMQSITGKLLVSSGTLNTGGFLTLKSTSIANTAIVDQVGGAISGNVIVERYIPKGWRAYRDLAPGVYNATSSLFTNWQESGSYTSGTGIFITGVSGSSQSVNASTGLDVTKTGNTSAAKYTNTSATGSANWSNITDTKAEILSPYVGYRVLVRGDRNFNLFTGAVSSTGALTNPNSYLMYSDTKIRSTGQLIYGTVTYRTQSNGGVANSIRNDASVYLNSASTTAFSMIANPYISPVFWGSPSNNANNGTNVYGQSQNINATYWYLDPTTSGSGKFIAYNALTGTSVAGFTSTSSVVGTPYIQPGQAFFVQNFGSTSPQVVFTETSKAASSSNFKGIFGISSPLSKIYLNLLIKDSTGSFEHADGAAIAFASGFTNTSYGPQDAIKFANATDNLSITDKGKNLSIDGRLPATANDVLPISLDNLSGTVYQFKIDASDYSNNGLSPYLVDSYKGTSTLINGSISVDFTVDAKVATTYTNRFSIVFKPSTLAVNSLVASATLNNKIATISWNTVGEKGAARFEVEKSTDAKSFTKIGQATAKNTATATYSATDNSVTATTYYRIKAISEVGTASYSNVAKVQLSVNSKQFTVYPNPLVGKTLNVSFGNLAAGKYTVSITNVLGQKVQDAAISHSGGNGSRAISINKTLAAGTYGVTIRETSSGTIVSQSNLSVN